MPSEHQKSILGGIVIKRFLNLELIVRNAAVFVLWQGILPCQSGPIVWVVPSLQRVGPSDAAGSGSTAQLVAAKGEYQSFQIVVRAPSSGLTNVNVSVSDLTGSEGAISKSNLALFREQYVYVNKSSPNWGGSNQPLGAGWYADGLIPFVDPNTGLAASGGSIHAVPFNLGGGSNQPIWVDVFVPAGAAPGTYNGTFTVTSSQGSTTGEISLQVWHFTLPAQPTLKSSFAYWTADSLAAEEELLRNRISPLSVPEANQTGLVKNFGLGSNNISFFSGADVSSCTMSAAPSVAQFAAAKAANLTSLYLFDYSADEVGNCTNLYPTIQKWAYNMHQAGINNLVTIAPVTALFSDGSTTGRSAVDDWVVLPVEYNGSISTIKEALAKGDEVWSYNTLVQDAYSPKWEIDFSPINFRIQPGFINQSLGLTGLLYWRIDDWNSSPWTNVNNAGTFSSNNYPGEGVLVYPGSTVGVTGVAPSMRLKWIRDGEQDYEYVALLKKAGKGTWALQVADSVGPDWTNWTRSISALASARQQLGEELDTLGGGSTGSGGGSTGSTGTAPAAPASPSPAAGTSGVSTTPTLSWTASSGATSYEVYFGTSSSPSLVATVSGNSYKPASLASTTKYYWRVAAANSSGAATSATWSFTTDAPSTNTGVPADVPASVSASPSSGSALYHVFDFVYSDSSGYQNLTGVHALFNAAYNGDNACWLYYNAAGKVLSLASDNASAWSSLAVGSAGTIQNSQCQILVSGVVVSGSGNTLTLSVPIVFATSFSGAKSIYLNATDKNGTTSSTVSLGTWTVPASASLDPVAVSPSSGGKASQTFTAVFSDPNGYQRIGGIHILVNTSVSGSNACWIYYDAIAKTLWLASNDVSSWSSTPVGSGAKNLENSQCEIAGGGISVSGSGTSLTLNIPITFLAAFSGARTIYASVTDQSGPASGYLATGTWNVP